MPELPEVESFRRSIETHCCQDNCVSAIQLKEVGGGARTGQRDDLILDANVREEDFLHCKLVEVQRKGKHLVLCFDGERHLCMQFGLSGAIQVKNKEDKQAAAGAGTQYLGKTTGEWPPKYSKMIISLGSEVEIALVDPRRMARCTSIAKNESLFPDLAADPLLALPSEEDFSLLMSNAGGKRPIKTVLLDQMAIVCGLGNYLVDEILHHARIHPNTQRGLLSNEQIMQLRLSIQAIVNKACECAEKGTDYPEDWLFHGRWESKKKKDTRMKKTGIVEMKIAGRTTLFNPKLQEEVKAGEEEEVARGKRVKLSE